MGIVRWRDMMVKARVMVRVRVISKVRVRTKMLVRIKVGARYLSVSGSLTALLS